MLSLMADTVLYHVTESLATITLNRPEAMNALDVHTKEALRDALRTAAAESAVRAVLLTGSGRAFCVGQDLKEHIGILRNTTPDTPSMNTVVEHYNPITEAITEMRKPVLAAVNGAAAGAGFGFALAADYRLVAESASFHTSFAQVGLGADSGLSWTLPRVVGPGTAADLLLFPRSVDAAEALRLGIAQRVVPDDELASAAQELGRRLAEGPTLAYAAIKDALAYGATHTLPESLAHEAELQQRAGASADHRAAVTAFVAKERPRFQGN